MRWILLVTVILTVALAAFLSGCGGKAGEGKKESAATQAPAAGAPAGGSEQEKEPSPAPEAKETSKEAGPKELEKIVITIPAKSVTFLPQYIGVEKGIYKKYGLDATIADMRPEVGISALIAGEVDYTAASGSTVRSATTGAPVKLIMYTIKDLLFSIWSKPEIGSVEELRGKTIGGDSVKSTNTLTTRDILKHFNIDPDKDVKLIMLGGTSNQFAALTSNSIDATILSPPFDAKAAKAGYKLLVRAADVLPGRPMGGMGTTDKKIKENPDQVKRVIRATLESIAYIRDNPEDTQAYIAKQWQITPEEAKFVYGQVMKALSFDGKASEEGYKFEIEMARQATQTTKEVPQSQVFDFSLLEEVLKEQGAAK